MKLYFRWENRLKLSCYVTVIDIPVQRESEIEHINSEIPVTNH